MLAPLLGGRWSRIGKLRLRLVWLFYVAIAVQLVAFPVKAMPWHTSDRIGIVLWLCSYGLFAAGVAGNFRIPGIPLIAAGVHEFEAIADSLEALIQALGDGR